MADKPSRALVIYGDGHAALVSPSDAHLHSFASRASCGFLSLRDPPDAQEPENDRRAREISQILDVYDFYMEMKGEHAKLTDTKDLTIPTISQKFMGLRAAFFTNCPIVGLFASNLGFSVLQVSELIERSHSGIDSQETFDSIAIVSELLKFIGFSGGEVLEKHDYDLVLLHVTPGDKLKDDKRGLVINTDVDFLNKLVGAVMHAAQPGSAVASRLHSSILLGYGAVSNDDKSCTLSPNSLAETNSDLLLLCPRQSYTMKVGNILPDIRHHHPLLIVQWQEGVTRRDMAMKFDFDEFREVMLCLKNCRLEPEASSEIGTQPNSTRLVVPDNILFEVNSSSLCYSSKVVGLLKRGCNLAILADRFLHEVAFKLWKAPKYGA